MGLDARGGGTLVWRARVGSRDTISAGVLSAHGMASKYDVRTWRTPMEDELHRG